MNLIAFQVCKEATRCLAKPTKCRSLKAEFFSTVSAKLLWCEILPDSFIRMVLKAKKINFSC